MGIKNISAIREKAKKQIISLLEEMKCFRFREEGIDLWLNTWQKACEPQITQIAEKSPYYDGDCKVVFPSKYPRNIDTYEVNKFIQWLYDYPSRNMEEGRENGFTYSEAQMYVRIEYYARNMCKGYSNDENFEFPEDLDILNQLKETLENGTLKEYVEKAHEAIRIFENYRYYTSHGNGKMYPRNEFMKLAEIPHMLAEFLNGTEIKQFLNRRQVNYLSSHFPDCRFAEGQKLSRAVTAIGRKYGLTSDPEWNHAFAQFADAVNPLMVTKWTVISWHPVDYLTFCFGNGWSTCSTIDKLNVRKRKTGMSRSSVTDYIHNENYAFRGEHCAAALSYMFDKTSFIYYTVSKKYEGTLFEEQDKSTRIVFSLNDEMDTLLESRLYPQCNDDNPDDTGYRIPREIVQKVICDSLEVPNLWKVKKGRAACCEYAHSTGVHYADYADRRNKQCNISWRGDEPHIIYIGHDAICPECGRVHENLGSLNCWDCDPM